MDTECLDFAMSLVNNVSLHGGQVLTPTKQELLEICMVLAHLDLRYTDNDMFEILHRNCPEKLLNIFQGIKVKAI